MKFLADMGVAFRVVYWLRHAGHDAVHLREQGLQRMSDVDIFLKAKREGRIILTFDLDKEMTVKEKDTLALARHTRAVRAAGAAWEGMEGARRLADGLRRGTILTAGPPGKQLRLLPSPGEIGRLECAAARYRHELDQANREAELAAAELTAIAN